MAFDDARAPARIAVLGTGAIGTGIARAFARAESSVTAWNRTRERAQGLAADGVVVVDSVADAVTSAHLVVVCVQSYDVVRGLLDVDAIREALRGRTLLVVSTGTAAEARDAEGWAQEHGIDYLDCAVGCYPRHLGTDAATVMYAGRADLYERWEPVLQGLGGERRYLGDDVGRPAILDQAELVYYYATHLGFILAGALAEAEGMTVTDVLRKVHEGQHVIDDQLDDSAGRMAEGRYGGAESSLAVDASALEALNAVLRGHGIDASLTQLVADHVVRAVAAGHGEHEFAAIYEQLRPASSVRSG